MANGSKAVKLFYGSEYGAYGVVDDAEVAPHVAVNLKVAHSSDCLKMKTEEASKVRGSLFPCFPVNTVVIRTPYFVLQQVNAMSVTWRWRGILSAARSEEQRLAQRANQAPILYRYQKQFGSTTYTFAFVVGGLLLQTKQHMPQTRPSQQSPH